MRALTALLIVLVLSGCDDSSIFPRTAVATPSPTVGLPMVARGSAPTVVIVTPTPSAEPATEPTLRPTVTPTPLPAPTEPAPPAPLLFSYPIGAPGQPPGDSFFIRHGAEVENTWYNPGYWHTGEDWYAIEGDTAGAQVYAIAEGEVVYTGANYPGRVVIVRHAGDLFSMYGHLDPALNVRVGQQIARGALIGTVLRRGDETPNHLHFEVRTFLTTRQVNGAAPRYPFRCGQNCPPGPGYWPIEAPDLPSDLGWRNPTHAINRRMLPEGASGQVVVASKPASNTIALWSAPPGAASRERLGELRLRPGERFTLLSIYAGPEDTRETSALAYQLWYEIERLDGRRGWVQAAVASTFETGGDGRPSSVYFNFFPT